MRLASFIIGVLVAVLFITSSYIVYTPFFNANNVTIQNQSYINETDIYALSNSTEAIKDKVTTVSQATGGNQFVSAVWVAGDVANVIVQVLNIVSSSFFSMLSSLLGVTTVGGNLYALISTIIMLVIIFALINFVLR